MVKRDDRIITSVYLTKEMCSQIDRMPHWVRETRRSLLF